MAAVHFRTLWLNPADDLPAGRSFRLHEMKPEIEAPGEFRQYAGGRVRLIRRAGRRQGQTFVLRHVDVDTVRLLEEWTGRLLLVRDPQGRKFYGAYLAPEIAPRPLGTSDVTLTFRAVTVSEAV